MSAALVWGLFDRVGNRVGGDYRTRNCALLAVPTSERKHYKALEVAPAAPAKPARVKRGSEHASREEQHARYLDCGPGAWDDR